ncbi:TcaA 3rd/4th domain-containing protein [Seinonella peptonophila]|uniref:TcaA 3rd/4th domain-containing protein n=1 Tax=Seinonella peptonophila TaxID=112248 RepID=UPI003BF51A7F
MNLHSIKQQLRDNIKIFIVIGLVLLTVILYFIFKSPDDEEQIKMISSFEKSILMEDIPSLKEMIEVEDDQMQVNDENLKQLIIYCKNHPNYLSNLIDHLYAQYALYTQQLDNQSQVLANKTKEEVEQEGDFYLKKDKTLFGTSYHIVARTKYIQLNVENEDATVKIGDKVIHISRKKPQKVGPFFPSIYHAEGKAQFPYASISIQKKWEIDLLTGNEQTVSSNEQITGDTVEINTKFPGVHLYSNGKNTSLTSEGSNNSASVSFYPITEQQQKVYGELKLPWGNAKSNEVIVSKKNSQSTYELSINPLINGQIERSMVQAIENFSKEVEHAFNKQPVEHINQVQFTTYNIFEQNKTLLTHIKGVASSHSIAGVRLKGIEILRLPKLDPGYQLIIPVRLTFDEMKTEGLTIEGHEFYEVRLKYANKSWQVNHVNELAGYPLNFDQQQSIMKKY